MRLNANHAFIFPNHVQFTQPRGDFLPMSELVSVNVLHNCLDDESHQAFLRGEQEVPHDVAQRLKSQGLAEDVSSEDAESLTEEDEEPAQPSTQEESEPAPEPSPVEPAPNPSLAPGFSVIQEEEPDVS